MRLQLASSLFKNCSSLRRFRALESHQASAHRRSPICSALPQLNCFGDRLLVLPSRSTTSPRATLFSRDSLVALEAINKNPLLKSSAPPARPLPPPTQSSGYCAASLAFGTRLLPSRLLKKNPSFFASNSSSKKAGGKVRVRVAFISPTGTLCVRLSLSICVPSISVELGEKRERCEPKCRRDATLRRRISGPVREERGVATHYASA